MPLLVFEDTQFRCGANLLFCGLGVGGRFSLLAIGCAACKSNMLFCLLRKTIKFMIVYLFLVLAPSNLVECIITSTKGIFFLPCKQPKNPKSVVNLEIFAISHSWIAIVECSNL